MTSNDKAVKIPGPGKSVRGSKTGQPIMVLFDLMGRRWAMGIIWNLHGKQCTFRELQQLCPSISPTVLNTRLKELRACNLVSTAVGGYCLTRQGERLYGLLEPLGKWAKPWASQLNEL